MNVQSLVGKKIDQTQGFLEDGRRVPLSVIAIGSNVVTQVKNSEKEGYNAVQVGFGSAKKLDKPTAGHIKKLGLDSFSPKVLKEVRVDDTADVELGASISVAEVFELGDLVDVTGVSKGKGFAGVVKKWGFAGGPRTHGQSDRERARGSSGSGTTPGRVYKGKKMAGRMGNEQVTVKNLEILDIQDNGTILVRGLVPGSKGAILTVKKVGKNKKFVPLWSEKEEVVEEAQADDSASTPVVETPADVVETPNETVETPSETVETTEEVVETPADVVETPEDTVETAESEVTTPEEKSREAGSGSAGEGDQNAK